MNNTLETPLLARLKTLLATHDDDAGSGGAMVQGRLPAPPLSVAVADVGVLSAPATATELAALRKRCHPAPFGLREQTLIDPAVRDTGEIDADGLTLTWADDAQARLCAQIAEGLGLKQVALVPHKLLCYGPGQFFKPHQDTARDPEMVGTLVLIWPSAHRGGELKVRHRDREGSFNSQQPGTDAAVRWCAFYADCQHEVSPVTEGQRIAISFEVHLPDGRRPSRLAADPVLKQALAGLFGGGESARQQPWYLLLDHQYNEHGLKWYTLKGRDRPLAAAVRAAAEAAGLTVGLALIEQMDVWNCPDEPQSGRGWGRGRFEEADADDEAADDEDDDEVDDEYVDDECDEVDDGYDAHDDLINRECSALLWVDADNRIVSRESLYIGEEIASLRPAGPEHLVDREYEGYMGNYGETMSYWYRRAALVVQSPTVALRLRYQTDASGALRQLAVRAGEPANRAAVLEELGVVGELLDQALRTRSHLMVPSLLDLAAALPADAAARLLTELHHASLGLPSIPALVRLQAVHGADWLRQQLAGWMHPSRCFQRPDTDEAEEYSEDVARGDGAPNWPEPVDRFLAAALQHGLDLDLIRQWQQGLLVQFQGDEASWWKHQPKFRQPRQAARLQWVQRLLRALAVGDPTGDAAPLALALATIRANPRYQLPDQAVLVDALGDAAHPRIAALRGQLQLELAEALAQPLPRDQGLRRVEWTCTCADCAPLIAWAESASVAPYVVAVAERRRQHIERALADAVAPIRVSTITKGSPYQLQAVKAFDVAARDAEWVAHLEAARRLLGAP